MAMGGNNLNSGPAVFSYSDDVSDTETSPKVGTLFGAEALDYEMILCF